MQTALIRDFLLSQNTGVYIIRESDHRICYADEEVERVFGVGLEGQLCYQALMGRSEVCANCPVQQLKAGRGYHWELIRQGEPPLLLQIFNRLESRGGETYRLGRINDFSEYLTLSGEMLTYAKEARRQAERHGQTDALTGLGNRNQYMQRLAGDYKKAVSWGVLYLDVNNMKYVNDTLGHDAGDQLLRMTADALRDAASDSIHPYRIGGDEFVMVAPDCREEAARRLYEDCLAALQRQNGKSDLPCDVAVGWAWGGQPETLEQILHRADEAMYTEKLRKKGGSARGR